MNKSIIICNTIIISISYIYLSIFELVIIKFKTERSEFEKISSFVALELQKISKWLLTVLKFRLF
jgi:hypothetical protein